MSKERIILRIEEMYHAADFSSLLMARACMIHQLKGEWALVEVTRREFALLQWKMDRLRDLSSRLKGYAFDDDVNLANEMLAIESGVDFLDYWKVKEEFRATIDEQESVTAARVCTEPGETREGSLLKFRGLSVHERGRCIRACYLPVGTTQRLEKPCECAAPSIVEDFGRTYRCVECLNEWSHLNMAGDTAKRKCVIG